MAWSTGFGGHALHRGQRHYSDERRRRYGHHATRDGREMALELQNDTYIPEVGIVNRLETGWA
jgi:hypothetical protein